MKRTIMLLFSHGAALAVGFGLGIYVLPILIAPPAPDVDLVRTEVAGATYTAEFTRDLKGSDFLHWGEGTIAVSPTMIAHEGKLAPGPDYKLYLTKNFVEDEAGFLAIKDGSALIADIKTFNGFLATVPSGTNIDDYNTVVVWCETFGEFITAAKYR